MRRSYSTLSLLVLVVATLGWAKMDDSSGRNDEAAVRTVVQKYFDGMMNGSPETLAEAFDSEAFLIGPGHGAPARFPFERWAAGMDEGIEDPDGYVNRIVAVDVSGNAAMAKTELDWPNVRYVDYLSLLKIDGEWRIVNKIWHQEPSAAVIGRIDEVPLGGAELARYAGTYRAGETELQVWVEDDRLSMARTGGVSSRLLHVGDGSFVAALDPDNTVAFATEGERVTGFELTYEGGEVVAERVD